MICRGDFYLTSCGGTILGMEKTVEELGLEDWREVVVVGGLRGDCFPSGGDGAGLGVGGGSGGNQESLVSGCVGSPVLLTTGTP